MHLKVITISAVIYIAAIAVLLCPRPCAASPIYDATATSTAAFCPPNMAFIPAGEFLVKWDNGEPDERPEQLAFTPSYCIDKYEYPNEKGTTPKDNISYVDAVKICESQGKRMCGEVEWERACRGPKGIIYTDSQDYVAGDCNLNSSGPAPSGSFKKCVNEYGVYDMTGNLWEWADGVYAADTPWPIIKGGAYLKGPLYASCYARFTSSPVTAEAGTGFRCCSDPLPKSGMDPKKEKSCTAKRLQSSARRYMLDLLREPGLTDIVYHDDVIEDGRDTRADSWIIAVFEKSARKVHTELFQGKFSAYPEEIPVDVAKELVKAFKEKDLGDSHIVPDPSACWSCDQSCIYVNGTWYGAMQLID